MERASPEGVWRVIIWLMLAAVALSACVSPDPSGGSTVPAREPLLRVDRQALTTLPTDATEESSSDTPEPAVRAESQTRRLPLDKTWQILASSPSAALFGQRRVYYADGKWWLRIGVLNCARREIAVAAERGDDSVSCNQVGGLDDLPFREVIHEGRSMFEPITDKERSWLLAEKEAGNLTVLRPGEMIEYYVYLPKKVLQKEGILDDTWFYASMDGVCLVLSGDAIEVLSLEHDLEAIRRCEVLTYDEYSRTSLVMISELEPLPRPENARVLGDGQERW